MHMNPPVATEDSSDALTEYNRVAIDNAAKLHEFRKASSRPDRAGRPIDELVPAFNRTAAGVHNEYERMGNRPTSVALEQRAAAVGIEFEHLGLTLGTVLHHVDLTEPQSPEMIQVIRDTLLERKVIFFRDQHLDEDQQTAFGRQFGGLDAFPFGKPGENPFILEIVHGPGSPGTENGWHTDVTWMEQPSLGSIAQCVVTPPYGGDTLFADSHAAYLGLAPDLRDRIDHLSGINDYRIFVEGRGQGAMPDDLVAEIKERIPFGVEHPLVRTHPETGKPALYLHGGFLRHDSLFDRRTGAALDPAESKQIVNALLAQHHRPEYICRFAWAAGSIAFWDNRAVQHYAASDYYPHQRVLRRVTITGDRPFHDPIRGAELTTARAT
jgi:taurine dioxygenase